MISTRKRPLIRSAVGAVLALALLGCSTDSPTAPRQDNSPNPPGTPSAQWEITIDIDPRELPVDSTQPATVTVRVRSASGGPVPVSGTTMVLSTSLGEFNAAGSGVQSLVLSLVQGRADVLLFAGSVIGDLVVTGQLQGSVGRRTGFIVPQVEPVVANFQEIVTELEVTFQDTSSGNPTKWRWDFGDGRKSSQQNPTHTYNEAGNYVVTLVASKTDSEDTVSKIVSVQAKELVPSFAFEVDGFNVTFLDTSDGDPTSWRWDFGDGTSSSQQNPTHRYNRIGNYVVELTIRRDGISASAGEIIAIGEVGGLSASFSFQISGLTVTFLDTSSGDPTSWAWEFGDGSTSRSQNPTHTYGAPGNYAVTLRASRAGASDEANAIVTVDEEEGEPLELFITSISPNVGPEGGGTSVTITGQNFVAPLRVFFGGKLGDITSVNSEMIVVDTPPGDISTVPCDSNADTIDDGLRALDQPVNVTVELSDGSSETITNGFTYDVDNTCVPNT